MSGSFDPTTIKHFARLLGVEAWGECPARRGSPGFCVVEDEEIDGWALKESGACPGCHGTGRVLRTPEEIVGEAGKDAERVEFLERRYGKGTRWNGPSLGEDFLYLMQYHAGGNMVLWDTVRAAIDVAIEGESRVEGDAARQREGRGSDGGGE